MPLIRKKRIWWEPVPGATGYVVYVGTDNKVVDPPRFSWEDTAGMIFKPVAGKTTELVIPDEWPEFPRQPGVYRIAVTSRDDVGNESDPLFLSGVFSLVAPASPPKGGIKASRWPFRSRVLLINPLCRGGEQSSAGGWTRSKTTKRWETHIWGAICPPRIGPPGRVCS